MRPMVKFMFIIAGSNAVIGILNSFITPSEYRWIGTGLVLFLLLIQLIVCSIVMHSPNENSK